VPYWYFSISRTIGISFLMFETTRAGRNSILEVADEEELVCVISPELRLEDLVFLSCWCCRCDWTQTSRDGGKCMNKEADERLIR